MGSLGSNAYYTAGMIGIGTITPTTVLDVESSTNTLLTVGSSSNGNFAGLKYLRIILMGRQIIGWPGQESALITLGKLQISIVVVGVPLSFRLVSGNVGIGTTAPGANFEVNGTGIKLTANSGGSVTYADSSVQTTAWNGVLNGGDYAEDMRATRMKEKYEPDDISAG